MSSEHTEHIPEGSRGCDFSRLSQGLGYSVCLCELMLLLSQCLSNPVEQQGTICSFWAARIHNYFFTTCIQYPVMTTITSLALATSPLVHLFPCRETPACGSSCSLQEVVNSCHCCFKVTCKLALHFCSATNVQLLWFVVPPLSPLVLKYIGR